MVSYRVLNQGCVGVHAQRFHDLVLVERDGSLLDIEYVSDFLHRFAFGQQLQDLGLAGGQLPFRPGDTAAAQEEFDRLLVMSGERYDWFLSTRRTAITRS